MALKPPKNPYRFQTYLNKRPENQNTERKPKGTHSVALVMEFLAAENENRQLEDWPQADFGHVSEIFPLSVKTKSITGNFVH